jgi:hypothetical protein
MHKQKRDSYIQCIEELGAHWMAECKEKDCEIEHRKKEHAAMLALGQQLEANRSALINAIAKKDHKIEQHKTECAAMMTSEQELEAYKKALIKENTKLHKANTNLLNKGKQKMRETDLLIGTTKLENQKLQTQLQQVTGTQNYLTYFGPKH